MKIQTFYLYFSIAAAIACFSWNCTHKISSDQIESNEILVEEEISYSGTDTNAQTLIIAYPKTKKKKLAAIVHFHGGGFRKGSASRKTAVHFAENGFIGISVNYRLSHEAIFPAAIHDCKTAIRWARANAKKYGIDPDRIGVFGGSAGGHLAALLAMSAGDSYLEGMGPYQNYASKVQVLVENYGPTDFSKMNSYPGNIDHDAPDSPESQFIGGPTQLMVEQVQKANPINYVDANDPPSLIFHGREDMSVPFNQSELLFEALQKAGVTSKFVPVENAGHGFKPSPPDATISPSREEIEAMQLDWFRKFLSK